MARSLMGRLRLAVACGMLIAFAGEALATCASQAAVRDWMSEAAPTAMPVRPAHCDELGQTPPDFSWPAYRRGTAYVFELRRPDAVVEKRSVARNWLLWGASLAPGSYAWRVTTVLSNGRKTLPGAWRAFTIKAGAQTFLVPGEDVLTARATSRERPRAFPVGDALERLTKSLEQERHAGWEALLADLRLPVKAAEGLDLPVWTARAYGQKAYSKALGDAKREAGRDLDRLLAAAFAYRVTGQDAYRKMALAKLAEISRWPGDGATGVSHHQVAGRYAWMLALAYDWLYADLSVAERRTVRDAIARRMDALLEEFGIAEGKMDGMPYNSHGWVALGEMAATATLLVGDDPRANGWFEKTVHPFIQSISPWAGPEGGMANGTGYGIWDLTALLTPMDVVGYALGMNLYDKAPLRNMLPFLMQFIPPGSPFGAFGDAAENATGLWVGDFVRAYAMRAPSPEADWYASQWKPRRHLLMHLFAPAHERADVFPTVLQGPSGIWAKTSGWVAMHADIADPMRTSVYFKSSPYGSFNHSHADQNSFVIVAGGRPVLIDSGYYDYYQSPHWKKWYTQTRAHNAVTFDGGNGQTTGDRGAAGNIIAFEQHGDYDVAIGEAAQAYGGAASTMRRTLIFVRPGALIVIDRAVSPVPRRWEWNLHALSEFSEAEPDRIVVDYGSGKGCVSVHSPKGLSFSQQRGFPVPPDPKWGADRQSNPQWHGVYVSPVPEREFAVVALIEMACDSPRAIRVAAVQDELLLNFDEYRFAVGVDGSVRRMP